jgi:Domain of unknown function (DUF4349)
MATDNRLPRRTLLPLLLLLLIVGFAAGCSGGDSADSEPVPASGAGGADEGAAAEDVPAPAPAAPQDGVLNGTRSAQGFEPNAGNPSGSSIPDTPVLQTRAVISTGTVTLQSKDVGQARFDVQKVVAAHRGEISDEQTATDPDGRIDRSRLVIRVPSDFFDDVMNELGKVADLRSAKRTSEDVTTQVIDTDVRVRAQEQSLERIELLLARAQSLRDIVAIESQLTRRQAELDSLKSQQAYLADQTTLATITVFLEQKEEAAEPVEKDEAGFLAGLESGWGALGRAATVFATGLGAILPFTVLLLLLGVPTWLLVRSVVRRRQPEAVPAD